MFAQTLKNNFTQLNENAVKHNYKFIVQQYYCFTTSYVFRYVKSPWTARGYHPPKSFTSLPPRGKGAQTVKLTTYLYQINTRPCHASRCMCMWKPGFDSMSVCLGFVVNKMALGHVLHRALRLFPTSIIPLMLHTHTSPIYHRCYITSATFSS